MTDPRDGRRVALKKLPNVFQSLVSSKRVFRELKMLCFFKHENVSWRLVSLTHSAAAAAHIYNLIIKFLMHIYIDLHVPCKLVLNHTWCFPCSFTSIASSKFSTLGERELFIENKLSNYVNYGKIAVKVVHIAVSFNLHFLWGTVDSSSSERLAHSYTREWDGEIMIRIAFLSWEISFVAFSTEIFT